MRILLVNSEFPYPPLAANSLIPFKLLKQWYGHHEVTLFCLAAQPPAAEHYTLIKSLCQEMRIFSHNLKFSLWSRLWNLFSLNPYGVHLFYNRSLMEEMEKHAQLDEFDVVVALCINTVQYAAAVAMRVPTIATPLDAVSLLYSRRLARESNPFRKLYLAWQKWRISSYEQNYYSRMGAVVMVSEGDKEAIAQHCPDLHLFVAPLGVEIAPGSSYRPHAQFIMSGNFGYAPNHDAGMWLLKEIWAQIRDEIPDAKLRMVGRGMTSEFFLFDGKEGVAILGEVPSIRDELAAATIALNPMRYGSGVRIKVLEAFATGTPVVSTPLGVEGLPVCHGEEALLEEKAQDFAHAAVQLANNLDLQEKLRKGGLALVGQGYSWENYALVMEEAIETSVKNFSGYK